MARLSRKVMDKMWSGVSEINAGVPAGRCPVDRLNRLRLNGFGELYQVICGYSGKQL